MTYKWKSAIPFNSSSLQQATSDQFVCAKNHFITTVYVSHSCSCQGPCEGQRPSRPECFDIPTSFAPHVQLKFKWGMFNEASDWDETASQADSVELLSRGLLSFARWNMLQPFDSWHLWPMKDSEDDFISPAMRASQCYSYFKQLCSTAFNVQDLISQHSAFSALNQTFSFIHSTRPWNTKVVCKAISKPYLPCRSFSSDLFRCLCCPSQCPGRWQSAAYLQPCPTAKLKSCKQRVYAICSIVIEPAHMSQRIEPSWKLGARLLLSAFLPASPHTPLHKQASRVKNRCVLEDRNVLEDKTGNLQSKLITRLLNCKPIMARNPRLSAIFVLRRTYGSTHSLQGL